MNKKITVYKIENNEIIPIRTRNPSKLTCKYYFNKEEAKIDLISGNNFKRVQFYVIDNGKPKRIRTFNPYDYEVRYKNRAEAEKALNSYDYTITKNAITILMNGNNYIIPIHDIRYKNIANACIEGNSEEVYKLCNLSSKLQSDTKGSIRSIGSELHIDNEPLGHELTSKIGNAIKSNIENTQTFKNFCKKLSKNPTKKVRENLYKFLSEIGTSFRSNGNILAYKYVDKESNHYVDSFSGTVKYWLGKSTKMDRKKVNHNPKVACSTGLHAGSWDYVRNNRSTILLVEIDPENVCCVPDDYSFKKMRCCNIKPICEIKEALNKVVIDLKDIKNCLS